MLKVSILNEKFFEYTTWYFIEASDPSFDKIYNLIIDGILYEINNDNTISEYVSMAIYLSHIKQDFYQGLKLYTISANQGDLYSIYTIALYMKRINNIKEMEKYITKGIEMNSELCIMLKWLIFSDKIYSLKRKKCSVSVKDLLIKTYYKTIKSYLLDGIKNGSVVCVFCLSFLYFLVGEYDLARKYWIMIFRDMPLTLLLDFFDRDNGYQIIDQIIKYIKDKYDIDLFIALIQTNHPIIRIKYRREFNTLFELFLKDFVKVIIDKDFLSLFLDIYISDDNSDRIISLIHTELLTKIRIIKNHFKWMPESESYKMLKTNFEIITKN